MTAQPLRPAPFIIVPWNTDFFVALREHILAATGNHPEQAVVIFPHDRPRRYLHEHFAAQGAHSFLPHVLAVKELFCALRPSTRPVREAGMIDRVALLHTACLAVSKADGEQQSRLTERLMKGDEASFFAWGERLAALLEECLNHFIAPIDLQHAETEVAPFGADLLAALGRIFTHYTHLLPERGRTTPGLDAYLAVSALSENKSLPPFLENKTLILAGFHMLSGTEERLFKHLWKQGAHILLHSDPALAHTPQASHWACSAHKRWITKWNAKVEPARSAPSSEGSPCSGPKPGSQSGSQPGSQPGSQSSPRLHFFSGHDLHSQLQQLAIDIADDMDAPASSSAGTTPVSIGRAVALTHPELLLPVLHHLPEKDCNISLGYPLERTSLHRLLECIMNLAEGRSIEGLVPWAPFSELVCHPWLRFLHPEDRETRREEQTTSSQNSLFPALLQHLDTRIRQGTRLQNPAQTAQAAVNDFLAAQGASTAITAPAPEAELLTAVLEHSIHAWSRAQTLSETADCLAGLAKLLASHGHTVWQRFPIDAECLVRLTQHIIGPLRDNDLAQSPLPMSLRHDMIRALLHAERVPFEADPLTGLQVLGMLETRLLTFSRVFLVDATDTALPGGSQHDPLLPDSLRAVLGLPDTHHREQLAAHTFHRLLAGAEEAFIYWQEGSQSSGLLDTVSQRSRLVEELVWQEEQRAGRILKPGDFPLRTSVPRLRPAQCKKEPLQRTPPIEARMQELLARPLSPARLDAYLTCPLSFYYQYAACLKPRDTVQEGDEPIAVGSLLHAVLQEAYTPLIGTTIQRGMLTAHMLQAIFIRQLEGGSLPQDLPPESAAMLRAAGPERLRRYLLAQPDSFRLLSLEEELTVPVTLCGVHATLRGRIDRIDHRASGVCVLDYKTGAPLKPGKDLWDNDTLWVALRTWMHEPPTTLDHAETGNALLHELSLLCPSVQLACYIELCRHKHPSIQDAAWVELRDNGEEVFFLGESLDEKIRRAAITESIPLLLGFIVKHMHESSALPPQEGTHCRWCSFKNLCILGQ